MKTAKDYYQNDRNQIRIFDTTLRDGRQAPECDMPPEDAIKIARKLDSGLKVDIIEAGVPADKAEMDLVEAIAKETNYSTIAAFARVGVAEDIDNSFKALAPALKQNRARIALLARTAQRLLRAQAHNEGKSDSRMLEEASIDAVNGAGYTAKKFAELNIPPDIQIYFEGASETPSELLADLSRQLIRVVLDETDPKFRGSANITLDYPDTHGTARENKYGDMFSKLVSGNDERFRVKEFAQQNIVPAGHCHNDFGRAVPNSIDALNNGARQIDGTILGIGERTGNADLIQILGNIYYKDPENPAFRAVLEQCYETARLVEQVVRYPIPRDHPFIGTYVASTAAGIHANLVRKDARSYNTVDPRKFGAPTELIALGPMMGKSGLDHVLKKYGVYFPEEVVEAINGKYRRGVVTRISTGEFVKKYVEQPDIIRMNDGLNNNLVKLTKMNCFYSQDEEGEKNIIDFAVKLNGREIHRKVEGDSIIGALEGILSEITGHKFTVIDYNSHSVGKGGDSEVIAMMRVACENGSGKEERVGYSISNKTDKANIRAYLNAISTFSFWES